MLRVNQFIDLTGFFAHLLILKVLLNIKSFLKHLQKL